MNHSEIPHSDLQLWHQIQPYFQVDLLQWFDIQARDLPWRRTKDPYRIWLSEMMLQQTRVDQAMPYYHAFLEAFPTVFDLAKAPLDAVLKRWEGLGYYARARNLHKAAKQIIANHNGIFPETAEEALALPGIGPYSAAAILSIAYQVPLAVLDGNVMRVLARILAFEEDIRLPQNRKTLWIWATRLLPTESPGRFNEAIMELGATVCTPAKPDCRACPLQPACSAYRNNQQSALPFVSKKPKIPHHHIAIGLVVNNRGQYLISRRPDDGLLGGLWEFPGGKQEPNESLEETCKRELQEEMGIEVGITEKVALVKHAYTHFKITLHAFLCTLGRGTPVSANGQPFRWVMEDELEHFAFPKANIKVIEALRNRKAKSTLFDETN
ncbi:MAG: A/G-specific adenine glycosylase [Bacteroidetes Order II. Incertae sedis bacterium]|nr:A/G-specific adenine glycosylase [Bacteroidetes Order II. bacterium]